MSTPKFHKHFIGNVKDEPVNITTEKYAWTYDRISGTGRFIRLSDDHMTLLETGIEAYDLNELFKRSNTEVVNEWAKKFKFYDPND
jgi:hypothetical protein